MAQKIMMENTNIGLKKTGYVGFSWTYLFFGFLVPLFRGEILISVLHFILSICTFWIAQFILCFFYNKQYTIRLIEKGYKIQEDTNIRLVELAKRKLGLL